MPEYWDILLHNLWESDVEIFLAVMLTQVWEGILVYVSDSKKSLIIGIILYILVIIALLRLWLWLIEYSNLIAWVSASLTHTDLWSVSVYYSQEIEGIYYDPFISLGYEGEYTIKNNTALYTDLAIKYWFYTHQWDVEFWVKTDFWDLDAFFGAWIHTFWLHDETPTWRVINILLSEDTWYISTWFEFCPQEDLCIDSSSRYLVSWPSQWSIDVNVSINKSF